MNRAVALCEVCGKTITPEEVEVGISLVCPRCAPRSKAPSKSKDADDSRQETGKGPD